MGTNQTTIFTAVLITGVIIGVIIIYFIISIIRQQRINQALYRSKILAEITTLEKERARIAADLHDELGPILSSVKLRINNFQIESAEDGAQLEKVNKHIDDMMSRMREISNDLMPTILIRKGLVVAIREFAVNISKPQGMDIRFSQTAIPELAHARCIHLHRIVQELIHNSIKHSGARNIVIGLSVENKTLSLHYEDDGCGFDQHAPAKEKNGLGMRSLLSRTELMGGEMFLDTSNGKGTRYSFEIPLNYFE